MSIFDIFIVSVGLSMDNMAVAAASACKNKYYSLKISVKVALSFCLTGIICFILGWYGGSYLKRYINFWDHLLSFFILIYIGSKMIIACFKTQNISNTYNLLDFKTLIMLALATNLDVLAIGLTLAFYKPPLILVLLILSICIISFTLLGFFMGRKMGSFFGKKAELIGGVILVIIALKILARGILFV